MVILGLIYCGLALVLYALSKDQGVIYEGNRFLRIVLHVIAGIVMALNYHNGTITGFIVDVIIEGSICAAVGIYKIIEKIIVTR